MFTVSDQGMVSSRNFNFKYNQLHFDDFNDFIAFYTTCINTVFSEIGVKLILKLS